MINRRANERHAGAVKYFPPDRCYHSWCLKHKSHKVILQKFTAASKKETFSWFIWFPPRMAAIKMIIHCIILPTQSRAKMKLHQELYHFSYDSSLPDSFNPYVLMQFYYFFSSTVYPPQDCPVMQRQHLVSRMGALIGFFAPSRKD